MTGAQTPQLIDAAASGTGSIYMHEKLALLRTLAARPSPTVAPCLQSLLDQLVKAGYVARDQSAGWMTTALGCEFIENARVAPDDQRFRSQT